jgi:hypothetical protein
MSERAQIHQTKEQHKDTILTRPNVVGVGTGYKIKRGQKTDQLCVVTLVSRKLPPAGLTRAALMPKTLNGVPVDVVEVGLLRAFQAPTDRWRPSPAGVSIGHYKITAGTFGAVVRDRATDDRLILSNNHVLANGNDAQLGDPILQPGPADGGQMRTDTIARLERFIPIVFDTSPAECNLATGAARLANAAAGALGSRHRLEAVQADPEATNLVDAAVARPANDDDILDEIVEIGEVAGTSPAMLGMSVRKSGRTTGFTTGDIVVLDATVTISYGVGQSARFEDQIVTSAMSQGGDSGALLVAGDSQHGVGLLFAGSDQATIHNPIQTVLDALEVTI